MGRTTGPTWTPRCVRKRHWGRMAEKQLGSHSRARGGSAAKTQPGRSPRCSQGTIGEAAQGASV
eukprot:739574-Alexandrium_andersonii.AAC.1